MRQDVKPLLNEIIKKDKSEKLYLYYGSLTAYSYYSKIMDLPYDSVIAGTYPKDEKLSREYLVNDLEQIPQGIYYLLFVKGTWTYERDIEAALTWLNKNSSIEEDIQLKSARLLKVKIR